jgi:hypothetical protein
MFMRFFNVFLPEKPHKHYGKAFNVSLLIVKNGLQRA